MFKKLFPALLATSIPAACAYPSITEINNPPQINAEVVPIKVVEKEWTCPGCNPNERFVLKEIQKRTKIRDRNALATIMGNIKAESGFRPNVCEGGAIVPYKQCRRGGYGLIQWTTTARYNGLGKFCKKYNCDPSSLDGQVRYMLNENQFRKYLPEFACYYWLGWGIKGNRQHYAYNYSKKLVWA
jgi:hypothetical protein